MSSPSQHSNHKRWAGRVAVGVVLAGGLLSAEALAATCSVPSANYPTIQSAANDAGCDVIQVAAGVYTEQVTIGRANGVTLQGAGAGRTIIRSPATRQPSTQPTTYYPGYTYIIEVKPGTGADILDLTVDGTGNSFCGEPLFGVRFNNANGSLQHVVVDNVRSPGADLGCQNTIAVAGTSDGNGSSSLSVLNSTIRNFQKVGILINGSAAAGALFNNIVRGVGPQPYVAQNGIQFSRGGFGNAVKNIISDVQYTGDACLGLSSGLINYLAGSVYAAENVFQSVDQAIYLQQNTGDQTIYKNRVRSGSSGITSDSNAAGKVRLASNGVYGVSASTITNAAACFPANGSGITVINESGSTVIGNSTADTPAVGILLTSSSTSSDVQQNQGVRGGTAELQDAGTSNAFQLNACRVSVPAGLCALAP